MALSDGNKSKRGAKGSPESGGEGKASDRDVGHALRLLDEPRFHGVSLTARGGGTGTNGQALTTGIVMDVSRHMRGILELNLDAGWVRVQPGVVLDQLNDHLRPHGVAGAPATARFQWFFSAADTALEREYPINCVRRAVIIRFEASAR